MGMHVFPTRSLRFRTPNNISHIHVRLPRQRKICGIAPEKRSKIADTDAVVPAIVVVVAAIVS